MILNDVNPDLALSASQKIIDETGGQCIAIPGDSSDQDLINRLVSKAVNDFESLDIVIANAGITLWGDFIVTNRMILTVCFRLIWAGRFSCSGCCQTNERAKAWWFHFIYLFSNRTSGT